MDLFIYLFIYFYLFSLSRICVFYFCCLKLVILALNFIFPLYVCLLAVSWFYLIWVIAVLAFLEEYTVYPFRLSLPTSKVWFKLCLTIPYLVYQSNYHSLVLPLEQSFLTWTAGRLLPTLSF